MQSRERISAAAWLVVKDAHVAEDIFQNTVLKAVTKDVSFEAEALVTESPKNNEGIPQGIEALEASLNEERMAQAVEMFEKLDKNKDRKITVPEVPAKKFENKVWAQANLNGDMILTWEEELIWQYNFQKKKAGESK